MRIERLLDEALIVALRRSGRSMARHHVMQAKLATEVGRVHEVGYHPDERRRVAIVQAAIPA